jgi:hypothetical protein
MSVDVRVFFEGNIVVGVDDSARSDDPEFFWDARALGQAVQDELGFTGVLVTAVTSWSDP